MFGGDDDKHEVHHEIDHHVVEAGKRETFSISKEEQILINESKILNDWLESTAASKKPLCKLPEIEYSIDWDDLIKFYLTTDFIVNHSQNFEYFKKIGFDLEIVSRLKKDACEGKIFFL